MEGRRYSARGTFGDPRTSNTVLQSSTHGICSRKQRTARYAVGSNSFKTFCINFNKIANNQGAFTSAVSILHRFTLPKRTSCGMECLFNQGNNCSSKILFPYLFQLVMNTSSGHEFKQNTEVWTCCACPNELYHTLVPYFSHYSNFL